MVNIQNTEEQTETTSDSETTLTPKEKYDLKKTKKLHANRAESSSSNTKKISKTGLKIVLWSVGIVGVMVFVGWMLMNSPRLPPMTSQGHVEGSPKTHISTTFISDKVQRHMLEHADGSGLPGVMIQYNCKDYACSDTLVNRLTTLAKDYKNVFLAPNTYDGMIILTKEGRREILKKFDEQKIKDFIR